MSNDSITIAVDAMGGENSPLKVLKGIELFCKKNSGVKIIIFGNKDHIEDEIKTKKIIIDNYEIHNTTENVNDNDNANTILRSRKNSSIFKGLEYVKNNSNSGFVSAGNTLNNDFI